MNSVKEKAKSVAGFLLNTITYFCIIMAIGIVVLTSDGNRTVMGYSCFYILTGSMQSVYPVNSLVIVKAADPNQIGIGDDITFLVDADATMTHRVVAIAEADEISDSRRFSTQGVENDYIDADPVYADNIIGTVIFSIPVLGYLLYYIGRNMWLFFLILILLVVLIRSLKSVFRKPKGEGGGVNPQEEKPPSI